MSWEKMTIKLLDKAVANKIAAGEVIERPFSVVKELVENSIDAGSDEISVEILNGGLKQIKVIDNGSGINSDELELAFLRHATSKIEKLSDLQKTKMLGFRGEALFSIAAVSKLEVISRCKNKKFADIINLEAGEIIKRDKTGHNVGTSVTVKDLFYNTPARLKFIKNERSEASLITDLVSKYAVRYPGIRFSMRNEEVILFQTRGKGDVKETIMTVYNPDIGRNLLEIENRNETLNVKAYISPPDVFRKSRKYQIYFVNGRYIKNKVIDEAINEGYKERIDRNNQPIAFLFIDVDPEKLDINVHPHKSEVRFSAPDEVKNFIADTITTGLMTKEALPKVAPKQYEHETDVFEPFETLKESEKRGGPTDNQFPSIKFTENGFTSTNRSNVTFSTSIERIDNYTADTSSEQILFNENEVELEFDINSIRILDTIFATYIIGVDHDSFYLIDQHAAHERVLYEKLKKYENKADSQMLISPVKLEIDADIISPEIKTLNKIGFNVEEFGTRIYIVRAIPFYMSFSEANEFLECFAEAVSYNSDMEKIIMASCKAAVKANDRLSFDEIKELMSDLSKCDNPFSCPHGRPTIIRQTKKDIEKWFHRI